MHSPLSGRTKKGDQCGNGLNMRRLGRCLQSGESLPHRPATDIETPPNTELCVCLELRVVCSFFRVGPNNSAAAAQVGFGVDQSPLCACKLLRLPKYPKSAGLRGRF